MVARHHLAQLVKHRTLRKQRHETLGRIRLGFECQLPGDDRAEPGRWQTIQEVGHGLDEQRLPVAEFGRYQRIQAERIHQRGVNQMRPP